jgi:putative membrane protein
MLKEHMAACLVATAFMTAPVLAQTGTSPATNPPPASSNPMPGTSSAAMQNLSAADFVNQAANSDMFEIQSSQAAQTKAQDTRVRDFAQRMVQDHTQASAKLKAAAGSTPVPTSLDQEHAQKLQQLQQASGNAFDRQYVQMQFEGHQKAVSLFENYAQKGDDQQLKQFAQQTAPQLREHLQMVTQIRNDLNAPARVGQAQPGQAGQSGQATASQFITEARPGMWRASQLRGLNVYNNNNEKIGDINDVLVDRDGRIEAVVIGVGGFLGIGEHDVAVPFKALQWAMEDSGSRTAATGTGGAGTTTGSTATGNRPAGGTPDATRTGSIGTDQSRNAPDRAILANASRDELRNAPRFNYNR